MGIYITAGLNLIDVVSRVIFVLDHLRPFVEVLYCYPEYRPTAEHSFSGIWWTELLFYSRHPLITELEEVEIQKNPFSWGQAWKFTFGAGRRARKVQTPATEPDEHIQVRDPCGKERTNSHRTSTYALWYIHTTHIYTYPHMCTQKANLKLISFFFSYLDF